MSTGDNNRDNRAILLRIPDIDLSCVTHSTQVQDEAVALVEAVPADRHLRCPDRTSTFDLEQPLHDHLVGDHVLEPGRHAPFL